MTNDTPSTLAIWYQAIRPRSLTATYIPIALGGVLAYRDDEFKLGYFALALLGTLALQIAANLFNEYFDHMKGVEAGKSHGLGLILKSGQLTPTQILAAGLVSVCIGILIGLFFVWQTGLFILWIGIGAVLVVVLYTAGPFPLAYIGMGELAVFIFMGPLIVLGAYYVLAEKTDDLPIIASLPIAFLVAAILHANNLRDLEADREGGKKTLAVRFGRRYAQAEYVFLTLGGHIVIWLFVVLGTFPLSTLLTALTLPETYRLCRIATRSQDPAELHMVLVHTARLHALFGISYVIGWLVAEVL
jgi:1,4-dihydroxy-2-naphthoate polyprenyltransferase